MLVLTTTDTTPAGSGGGRTGLAPATEALWLADLPEARRDALVRRTDGDARRQSLLGSRLLRHGLLRLGFGGDPLASLRYPAGAAPTLGLPVRFSLSHCEGLVVCALSTTGAVGVDAEPLGRLRAADFPSYLSAAERAWAGGDARRFYAVWTRKEAVAKAAGSRGLADMAHIDTLAGDRIADFAGRRWTTVEIPVGPPYLAHLAVPAGMRPPAGISVERVAPSRL